MRAGWAIGVGLFVVFGLATPFLSGFALSVLTLVFLFAWFGQAWNVVMGFTGQLSLGHALFVGLGGYVTVMAEQGYGLSPWIGLGLGVCMAGCAGAAIAWLAFRFGVKDVYFALLAIACAEVVRIVFTNWGFVGGAGGIFLPALSETNMPLVSLRGGPRFFYLASLFLAGLGSVLLGWLRGSRLGFVWRALRDDEAAARALGVRALQHKMGACALSAGMTAVGGALFAHLNGVTFPDTMMGMGLSIQIIVGPILGGLGTVFGPLVGAALVVPLGEVTGALGERLGVAGLNTVAYGLCLIGLMALLPGGVWPALLGQVRGWRA